MNERRHRRFTVRTILALTVTIAAVFALYARQVRYRNRQLAIVEAVHNLGGHAYLEYQVYYKEVSLSYHERQYDGQGNRWDRMFGKVTIVDLSGLKITDEDLKFLQHLDGLVELDLSKTSVAGSGLAYLNSDASLEWLLLNDSDFNTQYLHLIPPSLYVLDLSGTSLTDSELVTLKMPELVRLHTYHTRVTQQGGDRFNAIHARRPWGPNPAPGNDR